jgi:membrane protease YdiL (CAAX protease family)
MQNQITIVADTTRNERLKQTIWLILTIWIVGLIAHFTVLKEWVALAIYVIGSITLSFWRGRNFDEWQKLFITRIGLKSALLWGTILGIAISLVSLANIEMMHNSAPPQMQMQVMVDILIGKKLILFLPLLIVAEEFLWRGLLLSSLMESGFSNKLAIGVTSLCFMLNHFAVAPVGLLERGMMAMMALPLGIINGFLTLKFQNLWAGVMIHLLTMMAMILGIFLM